MKPRPSKLRPTAQAASSTAQAAGSRISAPGWPDLAPAWRVALQLVLFAGLALYYLLRSPGTYHDDDLDHYFMARAAFQHPDFFLNTWGRPALTVLYALPAQLGLLAARGFTILLAGLTAWLTWRTAARLRLRLAPAAIGLTLFQPLYFLLSFSVLAEPLAALGVAALLWCVAEERRDGAALVAGLLPLARLELIVFAAPVAVWLLLSRRGADPARRGAPALADLRPFLWMSAPLLAWAVVGAVAHGNALWLPEAIHSTRRPLTTLGPVSYLRNYIAVCGPVVLFGLALGAAALFTPGPAGTPRPVFAAVVWLLGLTALTLLTWERLKLGGSIGFLRHLIVLAPAATLVALSGFEGLGRGLAGGRRIAYLALAVGVPIGVALLLTHRLEADYYIRPGHDWNRLLPLLPLGLLVLVGALAPAAGRVRAVVGRLAGVMPVLASLLYVLGTVHPIGLNVERKTVQSAVEFLEQQGLLNRACAANHPWFYVRTGRDRWNRDLTPYVTHATLDRLPSGALVFWENHYGERLYGDVTEVDLRADARYERLYEVESGDRQFRVMVLQRR